MSLKKNKLSDKKYIDNVSFHFKSFDDLNINQIRKCCDKYNLAVIKNFIPSDQIEHSKNLIKTSFDRINDKIRLKNEYFKVAENYQRLCVGYGISPGTGNVSSSRLMRVIYNPVFKPDTFDLHDVFKKMIIFRNRIYDVNDKFCLNEPESGLFSCSRIHQFPKGGGFLSMHKDKDGIRTSKNANLKTFMHPLLIVDQKGKDFHSGGGVVMYDNEIIYYEDYLSPGDIAVYNGRTEHGVFNIDEEEELNLDTFNGRSSILVSLFKAP
jgi:hypothetical protein